MCVEHALVASIKHWTAGLLRHPACDHNIYDLCTHIPFVVLLSSSTAQHRTRHALNTKADNTTDRGKAGLCVVFATMVNAWCPSKGPINSVAHTVCGGQDRGSPHNTPAWCDMLACHKLTSDCQPPCLFVGNQANTHSTALYYSASWKMRGPRVLRAPLCCGQFHTRGAAPG